MKLEKTHSDMYYGEITTELDNTLNIPKDVNPKYVKHYILIDDLSIRDGLLAIRMPGRTVGHLEIDENKTIKEIVIYEFEMYPENVNELFEKFIGQTIEY